MSRKPNKFVLPSLVVLVGLGLAYVIATSKPRPEPQAVPPVVAPLVEVMELTPAEDQVQLRSQGVVRPQRQIDLIVQVSGVVTAVAEGFLDGAFVSEGQELLQIDRRDYENALARARAKLADARQALATENGRARQARKDWRELGDAEANALFLREPQLASARAQVQAAEADVRQAELDLARTSVRAPFAGRLVTTSADLGQYIGPGTAVASLYSSEVAEVTLAISERQRGLLDLSSLAAGIAISLELDTGASRAATIRRSGAQVDEQTRLLDLIAEIEAPFVGDAPLLAGQFVEASIPSRRFANVLRIPAKALRPGDVLWTLDADGRLRIRPVRVLETSAETASVQLAETVAKVAVITSYLARVTEGMLVQVSGS